MVARGCGDRETDQERGEEGETNRQGALESARPWEWDEIKVTQSLPTLQPHGLYIPWSSPGQDTEVGSPSLLQGIFPTQGSNPGLPLCRQILYQLSHKGSLGVGWGFLITFSHQVLVQGDHVYFADEETEAQKVHHCLDKI